MKKKIIAITLATALCVGGLMGCGNSKTPANESDSAEVSADTDAPDQDDTTEDDSDEDEQQAPATVSLPHYECKQEVLDADPGDALVQIADMVFKVQFGMDIDDVRAVVASSDTGLVCVDTNDDEGNDIIEIQDQNGNEAIHLRWEYCGPGGTELKMRLRDLTPVKYARDWVDYNSQYLAGGIPYNYLGYDDSVDMSSFTYTKEELIEKLRSEGFVSEEEVEEFTPFTKYYEDASGVKLIVNYPSTEWAGIIEHTTPIIIYTYDWNFKTHEIVSIDFANALIGYNDSNW